MVISVARPPTAPEVNGVTEVSKPSTNGAHTQSANGAHRKNGHICPRCSTHLSLSYDELGCVVCGFVDYSYTPPTSTKPKRSIVSTGTQYILRYVGDSPSLASTLTHAKLVRLRNRVVFGVKCPFCYGRMEQSSLSGKRREVREERFKCGEGHRISLTPRGNGALGWK